MGFCAIFQVFFYSSMFLATTGSKKHSDNSHKDETQFKCPSTDKWINKIWGIHTDTHKKNTAAAAAKSLQACPTLCDPIDGNSPGSAVPGILQARTLEWVAISFSNAWKWKVKVKSLSRVWLLATPWTAAHQAPPPMGFSRQEYWSGVPLPLLSLKKEWNSGTSLVVQC